MNIEMIMFCVYKNHIWIKWTACGCISYQFLRLLSSWFYNQTLKQRAHVCYNLFHLPLLIKAKMQPPHIYIATDFNLIRIIKTRHPKTNTLRNSHLLPNHFSNTTTCSLTLAFIIIIVVNHYNLLLAFVSKISA